VVLLGLPAIELALGRHRGDMTCAFQLGRQRMHVFVDNGRHDDGAVHPYGDRVDATIDDAHPHVAESESVVLQREALQLGDPVSVVIGVHRPPRPGVIGERLPQHLRGAVELAGFRSSDSIDTSPRTFAIVGTSWSRRSA